MNRDEVLRCLEEYRDGTINREDAERLAEAIRRGDDASELIVEELSFSGWISEAMESLDADTFVRSFIERLYAEQSGHDFSSTFLERIEKDKVVRKDGHSRTSEKKLNPFKLMFGTKRKTEDGVGGNATKGSWLKHFALGGGVAVVVLAAVFVVLAGQGVFARRTTFGEVIEASKGVTVVRGDKDVSIEKEGALFNGDRVVVPESGFLKFVSEDTVSHVHLHANTVAYLQVERNKQSFIVLRSGKVNLKRARASKAKPEIGGIVSQHAEIELPEGKVECSVFVKANATRIKALEGELEATRITTVGKDGKMLRLSSGTYAIASDESDFTAHQLD